MQLSLPPDTPIVVDMSLAQPFYDVFDAVDRWQRRPDRTLDELPGIIAKIPELEDIDVEGRSVLEPYRNYRSTLQGIPTRRTKKAWKTCCNPPSGLRLSIAWT